MNKTTVLSFLLCILLICSFVLTACSDKSDDNSQTPSTAEVSNGTESKADPSSSETSEPDVNAKYYDENGNYFPTYLPEFKQEWKDYENFRVLVYSSENISTYFSEEIEPLDTTDDILANGVITRNNWIYDNYGIKVKAVFTNDVLSDVNKEMSGGTDYFDVAMPYMPACASLARNGNLIDLTTFDGIIDFNAPWWDKNATESMSIGDKVFFTTGDMSIMQKIVSSGIAFNKDLLESNFPGLNIYQIVDEGKWTIDKLYEMCRQVTKTLNDDDYMDENDQWGILDTGPSFFYGCGEKLITKDADNYPMLSLGESDRSISVAKKVLDLSNERKTWMATVDDFTDRTALYTTIVKVFGEGRSLFMALHFSAVKKLRAFDVKYGIIPAAKYDEDQDDYYSKCSATYAFGICIPKCVKDPDFSAYMIELMSAGGKNHISNTYYDIVLKGRDFTDEESETMLDKIFDGIVYDPAVVYGFSGLNNIFSDLISARSSDIVSKLDGIRDSVNTSIEEIIESYNAQ